MTHAIVYKKEVPAATLSTEPDGVTAFAYLPEYLVTGGPAIATTLPLTDRVRIDRAGAIPPFFAGLLPEGRRLTALRRGLKVSADDELSLIAAVGADLVGDVQVISDDAPSTGLNSEVAVDDGVLFSDLLTEAGMTEVSGIAGVQDKVSARMISLPASRANERYILKLSPPEYPGVVENEAFFLELAAQARVPAARASVIKDAAGTSGLLVRRFDRVGGGRIAMEDACQTLGLWPANKYDVSTERALVSLIDACPARPLAARQFFRQTVFAWLTGNGDVHAKNVSILATAAGEWVPSPAYDLPSTVLYGDLTMAMDVNGEDKSITRTDFTRLAESLGLPARVSDSDLHGLVKATSTLPARFTAAELPFSAAQQNDLFRELTRRRELLGD